MCSCCRSNSTTNCLEHESDDIRSDKDDGVGAWLESRKVCAVSDDDAREAEVEGGGDECWRNRQTDDVSATGALAFVFVTRIARAGICNSEHTAQKDLHDESIIAKHIFVQHDTASISDDLEEATSKDAKCKTPRLVHPALHNVDDEKDSKDGEIGGIAS